MSPPLDCLKMDLARARQRLVDTHYRIEQMRKRLERYSRVEEKTEIQIRALEQAIELAEQGVSLAK